MLLLQSLLHLLQTPTNVTSTNITCSLTTSQQWSVFRNIVELGVEQINSSNNARMHIYWVLESIAPVQAARGPNTPA